jgi:transposase
MHNPFVICEATGGYERALMTRLNQEHLPVCRVNPARVRAFARSEGVRAKTDPIDAHVLLRFAQEKELRPTKPVDPAQDRLAALLDRRSHLSEQIAREKNRLQNSCQQIHSSIKRVLRFLEKEEDRIEQHIRELLNQDVHLQAQAKALQRIQGVGEVTAWTILAYLGEITTLKRNEVVALAGVAPFNKDSGKMKGRRRIIGGRAKVRACLYMAATTAASHNPVIKPYVKRLRDQGKPYKCAIVAAMRKMLLHMRSELINLQPGLAS